ncbi:MAG: M13 family metallopeptidase [Parasphingorhabdus sp.]|uniref:M13 family metallopeptidase n=1 Tax=Parasphingorhabdus sp. TaxID=2709688 RepID=UPI0030022C13
MSIKAHHRIALALSCALLPLSLGACSTAASTPPTAQIGAFGFDQDGMDKSVAAGDDFYDYANGKWAQNTKIPSDKSNYGMFTALGDLSQERVKEILEGAKDNSDSKIGRAFTSFMDEAAIEKKGMTPIKPWLDQIAALTDKADYAALVAKADRNGINGPFAGYIDQDDRKPTSYIYKMGQAGLGMPDRDYYLSNEERLVKVRDAYRKHLAAMLTLAGGSDAQARADAILAYETKIAAVHWTREDSSDAIKTYNKMANGALAKTTPDFNMIAYLDGVGVSKSAELIVAQPSAIKGISDLIAATDIVVLKDQLIVRSLDSYADVLPKSVDQQHFSFYQTILGGTPEQEVRWKRAVGFTEGVLGEEVGKEYAAKYFPAEYKKSINALVANVMDAMGERINKLEWMQDETKKRAQKKLANFTVKVGYTDKWRDYSNLEITADDAFGNELRGRNFSHEYEIGKLGGPIRKWEWGMLPQTVNAYANFGMMEVVFPAAILQPPFFDPNADPALNYGGIGAVIGHEISHHFDDQGAKYDENGALNDWWIKEDVAAFDKAGKALIAQYDAYEALPGQFVKGEFTLGENIGDLAGLTIAYDAYRKSLNGKEAPVLGGLSGDQRFFLGWAQVWRRNYREENLANRLLTDPHAPSVQRAWVVRNLDRWYPAFEVNEGQKLYLAPEERVRVW